MDWSQVHFGPRPFLRERSERQAAQHFRHFDVKRLSPVLGAELIGVDLQNLSDEAAAEVEQAFHTYRVLFFRDQDLDTPQHLAFASRFGPLEEHPFLEAKAEYGEVVRFEKDEQTVGVENQWHSDVSWREIPSLGSVLRAVEVPAIGGDTLFADMTAAYEGLSDKLKQRIAGLQAVHDYQRAFGWAQTEEAREETRKKFPPALHPVVRTHPATGDKILYVNRIFTSHLVGMEPEESDALLEQLCRQAEVPEYQCRFRWEKNSVAFWDNRAVQHYAASDYWPEPRVMERVTIIGERPA